MIVSVSLSRSLSRPAPRHSLSFCPQPTEARIRPSSARTSRSGLLAASISTYFRARQRSGFWQPLFRISWPPTIPINQTTTSTRSSAPAALRRASLVAPVKARSAGTYPRFRRARRAAREITAGILSYTNPRRTYIVSGATQLTKYQVAVPMRPVTSTVRINMRTTAEVGPPRNNVSVGVNCGSLPRSSVKPIGKAPCTCRGVYQSARETHSSRKSTWLRQVLHERYGLRVTRVPRAETVIRTRTMRTAAGRRRYCAVGRRPGDAPTVQNSRNDVLTRNGP